MHPALSVIIFTVISGAGYGLLALLAIFIPFDLVIHNTEFILAGIALSLILITAGLLSSTFHLGHPERAWRAVTQWRSSWLSREGVLSLLTYIPALAFAVIYIYMPGDDFLIRITGLITAVLCMATVFATSMIYASLTPVPAWNNHRVPVLYLGFSIMAGAVLLNVLSAIFIHDVPSLTSFIALVSLFAVGIIKLLYWRYIDNADIDSTRESATGLGSLGKASLLQAPHTQENYIMKEMGFRIARKHALKLRRICFVCAFLVPFLLTLSTFFNMNTLTLICMILAAFSLLFGLLIERWLFFAEARHIVMVYY